MTASAPQRALGPGSVIRVIAPAGPFDRLRFVRGVEVLRGRGYEVRHRDDLFDQTGYFAGSDHRRLTELTEALADPEAGAVWAVRGGYGAMRLLPALHRAGLRPPLPLLVGFSDVTALHAVFNAAGIPSLHGPVVVRLGEEPPEVLERLWGLLESGAPPEPVDLRPLTTVRGGRATGPLLGGNLAVLSRLVGTPHLPDLTGAVLFLEDVGEQPYRLDRMLTHLELAGVPEQVTAVAVGQLTACEGPEGGWTAEEVVAERLATWGVPAALGVPSGHGAGNMPLPLGLEVTLDADAGTLSWTRGLVA